MTSRKRKSPRLDIRAQDDRICNYPTTARTGDKTRLGNRTIFFDDTDTVFYSTDKIISWPTTLATGSKQLNNNLTSSIFFSGSVTKNSEQYIALNQQFEAPGPFKESNLFEQDIKTSVFYNTGSALEKFGNDFLNNLGSKTKISFEIPMNTATQLQPSSASIYYMNSQLGKFEEIAVEQRQAPRPNLTFNEARMFGPLGNNVLSSSQGLVFDDRAIPFTTDYFPQQKLSYLQDAYVSDDYYTVNYQNYPGNLGRLLQLSLSQSALINQTFAATSSQYISMADYITQPFLLEKVIFEVPIKAGAGWLEDYTRFLRVEYYNIPGNDNTTPIDVGGPAITFSLINQINDTNRELILSSTLIPVGDNFASASTVDPQNAVAQRYAIGFASFASPNTVISSSDNTYTGTIRITAEPVIANGVTSIAFSAVGYQYTFPVSNGTSFRNSFAISVNPFGRGMRGNQSGRSIFGKEYATPLSDPISSLKNNFPTDDMGADDVYIYNYEQNEISPYLLLPNDKLIFAVSKYRACASASTNRGWTYDPVYDFLEYPAPLPLNRYHDVWIDTGSVKINLYGSLVKESKEFHDTLNSRLDTNAVHEMISNPILDEWDVASLQEFSGSYISQFMSGTTDYYAVEEITLFDAEKHWSRARIVDTSNFTHNQKIDYSIYKSEQVTPLFERAKFIKSAQLVCENETYYDSMIPRFDELFAVENVYSPIDATITAANIEMVIFIDYKNDNFFLNNTVTDWTMSFPFEPKYSSVVRNKIIQTVKIVNSSGWFDWSGLPISGKSYANVNERITCVIGVPSYNSFYGAFDVSYYTVLEAKNGSYSGLLYNDLIKILYASGDYNNCYLASSLVPTFTDVSNGYTIGKYYGSTCRPSYKSLFFSSPVGIGIRGWKYGMLNGFSTQSQLMFRRDRYGNFRDMLEQRLDAKFYDGENILTSPVNVKFVNQKSKIAIDPQRTFSSNLSLEATSSLPYFDGKVRNREEPINTSAIYSTRFTA